MSWISGWGPLRLTEAHAVYSSSTKKDLSSSSFSASAGISAGPSRHSPVSPCKPIELYLVTCYMHSKTFVLPVIFLSTLKVVMNFGGWSKKLYILTLILLTLLREGEYLINTLDNKAAWTYSRRTLRSGDCRE